MKLAELKNRYAGQTCTIVGRGPSLLDITAEDIGPGPVIVINEALFNIAELKLTNDIYSQWRNGDMPDELPKYLKDVALLLCENQVPQYEYKVERYRNYRPLYMFECRRDFGRKPEEMFSHAVAIEIAVRIFGCRKLVMIGFDSYRNDVRTVLKKGFVQSEYRPGDYLDQISIVKTRLSQLPHVEVEWKFNEPTDPAGIPKRTTPECSERDGRDRTPCDPHSGVHGVPALPVKINVGCGEVPLPGYINVDLHDDRADVKMDARNLALADHSVDEIYTSHLLEHLGKNDVPVALKEWARVLKAGGILHMNLPNLEWCLKNWLSKTESEKWGFALDTIFGMQKNDGEYHKTGFTKERLTTLLKEAGFEGIAITDHWSHQQSCFDVVCRRKPRLTVITCTGDRPEAFGLIRKWISHQTVQPDQWLVISDGRNKMKDIPPDCHYIRREPRPDDPQHTMILNLQEAVKHVTGDFIIIMEDDEYYAPGYIQTMVSKMEKHEVVGIGRSIYYHLPSGKYLKDCNIDNASLAQVAFRRSFLPEFTNLLNGDQYVDMRIWRHVGQVDKLRWNEQDTEMMERVVNGRGYIFDDGENHIYVGLKGLPGREGICWGHKENHLHYKLRDTQNRDVLRSFIGDDVKHYEKYFS